MRARAETPSKRNMFTYDINSRQVPGDKDESLPNVAAILMQIKEQGNTSQVSILQGNGGSDMLRKSLFHSAPYPDSHAQRIPKSGRKIKELTSGNPETRKSAEDPSKPGTFLQANDPISIATSFLVVEDIHTREASRRFTAECARYQLPSAVTVMGTSTGEVLDSKYRLCQPEKKLQAYGFSSQANKRPIQAGHMFDVQMKGLRSKDGVEANVMIERRAHRQECRSTYHRSPFSNSHLTKPQRSVCLPLYPAVPVFGGTKPERNTQPTSKLLPWALGSTSFSEGKAQTGEILGAHLRVTRCDPDPANFTSGYYIPVNLNFQNDRSNFPREQTRPLASGTLSLPNRSFRQDGRRTGDPELEQRQERVVLRREMELWHRANERRKSALWERKKLCSLSQSQTKAFTCLPQHQRKRKPPELCSLVTKSQRTSGPEIKQNPSQRRALPSHPDRRLQCVPHSPQSEAGQKPYPTLLAGSFINNSKLIVNTNTTSITILDVNTKKNSIHSMRDMEPSYRGGKASEGLAKTRVSSHNEMNRGEGLSSQGSLGGRDMRNGQVLKSRSSESKGGEEFVTNLQDLDGRGDPNLRTVLKNFHLLANPSFAAKNPRMNPLNLPVETEEDRELAFRQYETLFRHVDSMGIPMDIAMRTCFICTKRFTARGSLRRHMLTHLNKRPHQCTICNRRFRQRAHLKKHMRLHTGEKYVCPGLNCEKAFAQKGSLKNHVLRHHMHEVTTKLNSTMNPPYQNPDLFFRINQKIGIYS